MACATCSVDSTTMDEKVLGSTWRMRIRTEPMPIARAASMKSFSRRASTSARTTRAYRSQPVKPSTRMTVIRLGPSAATKARASRIWGKDHVMSTTVMMTVSARPPTKPLIRPSVTPTSTLMTTASTPTSSEMRAPWMMRLRMSRPT